MGFTKKIWKDRISEFPARRNLTRENGDTELVTVARSEGAVSQEGDAFSAENMNGLEERIGSGFDEINSSLTWKKLTVSHQTGAVSISLPGTFQELCAKVNINGLNVVVPIIIPYISLQSTAQSFRGGYYYAANANGTASLLTSTSSISLEWAYLNGGIVTAATNWIVYYR